MTSLFKHHNGSYRIYSSEKEFPEREGYTDTGEWMASIGYKDAVERWFSSASQVLEVHPGEVEKFIDFIWKNMAGPDFEKQVSEGGEGIIIPECFEVKSRCCGRCDGINDEGVTDMICDEHNSHGCKTCWPKYAFFKSPPQEYKCHDCGKPINEGEFKTFACCDNCWDKPRDQKESQEKLWNDVIDEFYVENDKMIQGWSRRKRLILEYQKWLQDKFTITRNK